jgi:hypothetical protein
VAFAANSRARLGFEFPRRAFGKARKSSRQERIGERLCMRIAQQGMWLERLHPRSILRHGKACDIPKLPAMQQPTRTLDFARLHA